MSVASLCLKTCNPDLALRFYTEELGFTVASKTIVPESGAPAGGNSQIAYYQLQAQNSPLGAKLYLRHDKEAASGAAGYELGPSDSYWKYSLFVDDIQRVATELRSRSAEGESAVSEPFQFGDVGYLAHLKDCENYAIELIQRTFKATNTTETTERQPASAEQPLAEYPLKELPQLGLITLRTADPVRSMQFYQQVCGLKLLVRMYVERGSGFTLYFYGPSHLTPPSSDIDAVVNREWLYQQPELFVELQHYWGSEWQPEFRLDNKADDPYGLAHFTLEVDPKTSLQQLRECLAELNLPAEEVLHPVTHSAAILCQSPDGHPVYVQPSPS